MDPKPKRQNSSRTDRRAANTSKWDCSDHIILHIYGVGGLETIYTYFDQKDKTSECVQVVVNIQVSQYLNQVMLFLPFACDSLANRVAMGSDYTMFSHHFQSSEFSV